MIGLGVNWEGKFDEVGIVLSATGEFGDSETAAGAEDGDVETISVGGKIDLAGFALGAGYVDFGEAGITRPTRMPVQMPVPTGRSAVPMLPVHTG